MQGLPFFPPIHRVGAQLDIYGPHQQDGPLDKVFGGLMCRPYFPVHFSELEGDVSFHDVTDEDLKIGRAKVKVRPVPHNGPTVGYRVDWDGCSVAYISDHQAPARPAQPIADQVLELADGVDLLIHDAQYTPAEFAMKATWGHCTVDYAVRGRQGGGRQAARAVPPRPGAQRRRPRPAARDGASAPALHTGVPRSSPPTSTCRCRLGE